MLDAIKRAMVRALKVPPEPDPPSGAPGSLKVFHAAPGHLRYRLLQWGLRIFGFVAGVFYLFIPAPGDVTGHIPQLPGPFGWILDMGIPVITSLDTYVIAFIVIQVPFAYLMVVLDHDYRWYMITDRSLRIREGIWRVRERTMTFSNIQNVSIRQGPLQRLFGISDIQVRSAGGGSKSNGSKEGRSGEDNLHVGYFRGVSNAEEIRDTIMANLHSSRHSGLGDPEEVATDNTPPDSAGAGETLRAAHEVLDETRRLRAAIAGARSAE